MYVYMCDMCLCKYLDTYLSAHLKLRHNSQYQIQLPMNIHERVEGLKIYRCFPSNFTHIKVTIGEGNMAVALFLSLHDGLGIYIHSTVTALLIAPFHPPVSDMSNIIFTKVNKSYSPKYHIYQHINIIFTKGSYSKISQIYYSPKSTYHSHQSIIFQNISSFLFTKINIS